MRKINLSKSVAAIVLVWTMIMMPLAAIGQTRIVAPKNKYKVSDDVKLGQDWSLSKSLFLTMPKRRAMCSASATASPPRFRRSFSIPNLHTRFKSSTPATSTPSRCPADRCSSIAE